MSKFSVEEACDTFVPEPAMTDPAAPESLYCGNCGWAESKHSTMTIAQVSDAQIVEAINDYGPLFARTEYIGQPAIMVTFGEPQPRAEWICITRDDPYEEKPLTVGIYPSQRGWNDPTADDEKRTVYFGLKSGDAAAIAAALVAELVERGLLTRPVVGEQEVVTTPATVVAGTESSLEDFVLMATSVALDCTPGADDDHLFHDFGVLISKFDDDEPGQIIVTHDDGRRFLITVDVSEIREG